MLPGAEAARSGDSYTQTGFNPSGTLPSPGYVLGYPLYPGYTTTGGENWVDQVTTQYNKSLLLTYNYAYGGTTMDAGLVPPYKHTVLSPTDQINQFLSGAANKPASTSWTSRKSLFSIAIGINDIGNSYCKSGDRDAFSGVLLDAYFALVQNSNPAKGEAACVAELLVITGYNSKLVNKVNSLTANHNLNLNLGYSHSIVLDSPTTYGVVDAASYGSDPNMFWGNIYHPSRHAYKFFGRTVGNAVLGKTVF